ncbi:hypothetical protein [Actinoallomurus iriomotensis]|uniref:Uncharacterized protein n=1 Tax=Actinoallomurus iriomotensis TaxID=478107 RepID=A0A9W6RN62_9ACTN|nr:hypothetical protein [Actinoallomurus iriomotensis]GLY77072.1 hypothetical protein Airi01_053390 [Actinoallomurus iriomotensis]
MLSSQGLDPATGFMLDVGDTGHPDNFVAPAYRVESTQASGQHTAKIVMERRAAEGDNTSIYLRAGVFETNYALSTKMLADDRAEGDVASIGSYLTDFASDRTNRVYLYMSADMAERNRRAEVEHCQDLIYAYEQTLLVLDAALVSLAPVTAGTEEAARNQLLANLQAALPRNRAHLGTDPASWVNEYRRLRDLTRMRDQGWHSFGAELVDAGTVPGRDTPTYLTGVRRDPPSFPAYYLAFNRGTTEIGVHGTAGLIV